MICRYRLRPLSKCCNIIALFGLVQKIGKAILELADINKVEDAEKVDQLNFEQFFSAIQTKLTVDNLQALFFVALYNHYDGNPQADSLTYQQVIISVFMTWNSNSSA